MMPSALPPPPATSASTGHRELDSASRGEEEEENGGKPDQEEEEQEEEVGRDIVFGREEARKMLDYLSNEQLIQVLQDATLRHSDVLEEVRRHVDDDQTQRKIFIRGLAWGTSTESLKSVFSQFGEVEEGAVIMDKLTGQSKGYGFITFKHLDSALLSLKEPSKQIDGRMTVSRLAATGPSPVRRADDIVARKIYVGNVPLHLPPQRLLDFFAQYGEIEEGPLGLDRQAGKSRGFALFIYKSSESAKRALEEPIKNLDGHQVQCKLAGEDQRQRYGAAGSDLSGISKVPYGTISQGMLSSFNQAGISPMYSSGSNMAMNAGISHQNLRATNSYLYPVLNSTQQTSSLPQASTYGVNQGYSGASQLQSYINYGPQTGLASYTSQMSSYGAQPSESSIYGGQSATYSGNTVYGIQQGSLYPQTAAPQGSSLYGIMPQTNSITQESGQYAMVTQTTTAVHGSSHYGMASQATPIQGTSYYTMGSYQNRQLDASSIQTASTTSELPSTNHFYGS